MVSYAFKDKFVSKIEDGTKTFTLRVEGRRRHADVGDPLHLWSGMRTKTQRLIFGKTIPCLRRLKIDILDCRNDFVTGSPVCSIIGVWPLETRTIDDAIRIANPCTLDAFARADGFNDFDAFLAFHGAGRNTTVMRHLIAWGAVPG
jgi:hypothetical protein